MELLASFCPRLLKTNTEAGLHNFITTEGRQGWLSEPPSRSPSAAAPFSTVTTAANDGHASGDTTLQIRRTAIFDTALINKNRITVCGGIAQAIGAAQQITPRNLVEVEVKTLKELCEGLETRVDIVVLGY